MGEFVLYVPVGGYSATAGIARGSAIVGRTGNRRRPGGCGSATRAQRG